jgi:hypothetical protein
MIQRIQSLYLIIAILLSTGFLFYTQQFENSSDIQSYGGYFLSPLLTLITLFLFKKMVLQARMCVLIMVFQISLISYYSYYLVNHIIFDTSYPSLGVSIILVVFLFLARRSILKDEALVRSVDRIR